MHSFIYQPEYPFRLFKRVKTLHMKLREATVQPIWTVSGSQLQSWSFHYLVLWRPTLWMAPSFVPLVLVSSKPVWNAKWKWHKRCCKNHSINEGRTLSFKQFFHCTDLKLVFSSCLIPFVLKKKKKLMIFLWPFTNKYNITSNACVDSLHGNQSHTPPRNFRRAENPVTPQLAGSTQLAIFLLNTC